MPLAVEQALVTLVPSTNTIPIELTSLANALLMQSRSKAAKLKADEEIARTYVCSHIACERLQSRLGLEIQPRPPVPPRVYKKLKTFFEKQLEFPSTPSTNRHIDSVGCSGAPSSQRSAPASAVTPSSRKRTRDIHNDTPSKTPAGTALSQIEVDDIETPSRRSTKHAHPSSAKQLAELTCSTRKPGRLFASSSDQSSELPDFVDDMIARLANKFESSAAPHIRAGLKHVIALRGHSLETSSGTPTSARKSKRPKAKDALNTPVSATTSSAQIPAQLIILTLFVVAKQKGWQLGNQEEFTAKQNMGLEAVREMEEGWAADEDEMRADLAGCLKAAGEERWLEAQWFQDIEIDEVDDGMDLDVPAPQRENGRMPDKTPLRRKEKHAERPTARTEDAEEAMPAAGIQIGLGTMFQDAIDWLSDDRREEYRAWEDDMLRQLDDLEGITAEGAKALGRQARPVASAASIR